MNKLVYLLFLSLPLGSIGFGHIHFGEIALYLNILFLPFLSGGNKNNNQIIALDIFVIIFAILHLISVAVDLNPLYESARYYRYLVLTPVLIYMVIRYLPVSTERLIKGMYFLVGGTLIQSVFVIRRYLMYGGRASFTERGLSDALTFSVLICISIYFLFFIRKYLTSKTIKIFSMLAMVIAFSSLIAVASRSAIIGVVAFFPFANRIWKSQKYRKRLAWTTIGILLLVMGITLTIGPSLINNVQLENYREISKSVDRLITPELYLMDLKGRLAVWTFVARQALQNPLFGSGLASYRIGNRVDVGFNLGSSHNMLISSLVTTGIPGLILLFLIIGETYRCLNKTIPQSGMREVLGPTVLISFTVLLMVALTNDFTGGRMIIFFFLMALAARLSLLEGEISNSNE
jgi:O-antigen ligase